MNTVKREITINEADSKRYGRVIIEPDPECRKCDGTGINKGVFYCDALNCTGHSNTICQCRELYLDCPYIEDHPNIHGNWNTILVNGSVYVECYNAKAHENNPHSIPGKTSNEKIRTVLFEIKI